MSSGQLLALLSALLSPSVASASNWAVLVAGSNGYGNYRHQADICHAYQIMKKKGVPEEQIIVLAYDDIAHNEENPFKGKLFNKPDPKGPGVDVYAGCNIDYKGKKVTPKTFQNVLSGTGDGKVLKSTADDNVFVFFSDHGAPGLIAFPEQELHKKQLQKTLTAMHTKKMFKKLVFYLESCESGSMFQGMKIPGVYGLSASNPKESSWGTYCDGKTDMVNGKHLGACLGDLFSVSWMEDADIEDAQTETLEAQFEIVKKKTNKSHVMQWGDESYTSDDMSEFFGGSKALDATRHPIPITPVWNPASSPVSTREVDLHRRYQLYGAAQTYEERIKAGQALQAEIAMQNAVEIVYHRFAAMAYPGDEERQRSARHNLAEPDQVDCELAVHRAIREGCSDLFDANSGFALQFHQVVVNICADVAGGLNFYAVGAAEEVCKTQSRSVNVVV